MRLFRRVTGTFSFLVGHDKQLASNIDKWEFNSKSRDKLRTSLGLFAVLLIRLFGWSVDNGGKDYKLQIPLASRANTYTLSLQHSCSLHRATRNQPTQQTLNYGAEPSSGGGIGGENNTLSSTPPRNCCWKNGG